MIWNNTRSSLPFLYDLCTLKLCFAHENPKACFYLALDMPGTGEALNLNNIFFKLISIVVTVAWYPDITQQRVCKLHCLSLKALCSNCIIGTAIELTIHSCGTHLKSQLCFLRFNKNWGQTITETWRFWLILQLQKIWHGLRLQQ